MNLQIPPVDILRGAIVAVVSAFWPVLTLSGVNLSTDQVAGYTLFTTTLVTLLMLFVRPAPP